MKKILMAILLVAVIAIAGLILFDFYLIPYSANKELEQIHYKGIIISMEEEAPCYVTVYVKQMRDTMNFDVGHCCDDNSFFEFTGVGDSIQKDAGSLMIEVRHERDNLKKSFVYPHCFR